MAIFIRILGARHTIESAMDIPDAPSRRKSMNAQEAINPLDTIVAYLLSKVEGICDPFPSAQIREWVALAERVVESFFDQSFPSHGRRGLKRGRSTSCARAAALLAR
jgi:hypothetical protein